MMTRTHFTRLLLLAAILLLGIGLVRQYQPTTSTTPSWHRLHTWSGTGTTIIGTITPPTHWQLLWQCWQAATMTGQIDHENTHDWSGDLHLVISIPCTQAPIRQELHGKAPAILAITTPGSWSVSLLTPDG